jgi:hypothetical protein
MYIKYIPYRKDDMYYCDKDIEIKGILSLNN